MQACDTIVLMSGMDINNLITNSGEFAGACAVILETKLTELPDDMVTPIAELQMAIVEMLGIGVYENFNSGPWASLQYV